MLFKSLKSKIICGLLTAALTFPSLVFGASVTINLKDHLGSPISAQNLSNVAVTVFDGFGSTVFDNQGTLESATVTISDLAPFNNYTVMAFMGSSINGKSVVTTTKKSISFANDNENLIRDLYLPNPKATNVLLRVSGLPTAWEDANLVLTPVQTSNIRHLYEDMTYPMTLVNGAGDLTVSQMPAGTFSWKIVKTGEETILGNRNVSIRDNSTLYANAAVINDQAINIVFNLKNADRSAANFTNEVITATIKNSQEQVVWSGQVSPVSGDQVTLSSTALPQGSYSITATMTANGVTKHYSRNAYVGNSTKVVNINPIKISFSDMTFRIKDSRTGANVPAGQVVIKRTVNGVTTTISTDNFSGGNLVKSLANGITYSIEVEADGYQKRTITLTPRETGAREISMVSI